MGTHVHEVNDLNFDEEVLKSDLPVLVDFTATWCGPCKMIAPLVDELATEYVGKAKVVKVDIDNAPNAAAQFGVRKVPTLKVFKGGVVVAERLGAAPKPVIAGLIESAL